jgi:hypothetical protein
MYGSAIWAIWIAVSTREVIPVFSRASWSASAFITVGSMPM